MNSLSVLEGKILTLVPLSRVYCVFLLEVVDDVVLFEFVLLEKRLVSERGIRTEAALVLFVIVHALDVHVQRRLCCHHFLTQRALVVLLS
jgi:hypothetical protein